VIDALESGLTAVIPTLDIVDTVSPRDPKTGVTGAAVDRSALAVVQTPQGFQRAVIVGAHRDFPDNATDDADIVRRAGHAVGSVPGDQRAFKITYPADVERATHLVAPVPALSTGIGVDVQDRKSVV
jgi:2-C-methyl-D-erythritol 4-phosphate cytidylyltransferase/2-C-methyl-D-erythritol 2,4-cyclodiphosphate synthase